MWILPLLIVSAIAFAAASKSSREAQPARQHQLPPPAFPGPISVLGEILRVGQVPPRGVILNAIAEAEALGLHDFVSDIERAFGKQLQPPAYERGSCALPRSPRAQADAQRVLSAPRTQADYQRVLSAPRAQADYQRVLNGSPCVEAMFMDSPVVETLLTATPVQVAVTAPPQGVARQATEGEILAVLHTDPAAFLAMIASGRPPMIDVPVEAVEQSPINVSFSVESPVEVVAQARPPGSPLSNVTDEAWLIFVSCLERESPTFDSSRHIGQYRQRRDRLAELGIDPAALHGSPLAQRAALDVDLADAHGHAAAGGLLEYLGRSIVVPGHEDPEKITLSGVLGVIQCAGLEGAAGWLEKASDRRRYPHTTHAFLHTNGVF